MQETRFYLADCLLCYSHNEIKRTKDNVFYLNTVTNKGQIRRLSHYCLCKVVGKSFILKSFVVGNHFSKLLEFLIRDNYLFLLLE